MKIALAQINPVVGDIAGNQKKILSAVSKAKADVIVFPELAITGYCPQDLLLKKQFIESNVISLQQIADSVKNKVIIVGFVDKKDGKLFNAAAAIENGIIVSKYYKQNLPNYSVFDEKRWFTAGTNNELIRISNKKIGLSICEDIWTKSVCEQQNQADFFINISASPYSRIKFEQIETILLDRNKETNKPILYVNQVSAQDGLVYYGRSMFVDKGKIVKRARDFEEDTIVVEIK